MFPSTAQAKSFSLYAPIIVDSTFNLDTDPNVAWFTPALLATTKFEGVVSNAILSLKLLLVPAWIMVFGPAEAKVKNVAANVP